MIGEVIPTISFDRRLGEFVDDVSVDYPQLVAMMRERGFSDEEITKTEIMFHGDTPSTNVRLESGDRMIPTGSYDYITRQIGLYPRNKVEESEETGSEGLSVEFSKALRHELEHHAEEVLEGGRKLSRSELIRMGRSAMTLLGSFPVFLTAAERGWNSTLQAANYDPGSTAQSIAAIGSVAIASVGALGLARPWKISYAEYRASSTEVRSYDVEQEAPENLVTIRPKRPETE